MAIAGPVDLSRFFIIGRGLDEESMNQQLRGGYPPNASLPKRREAKPFRCQTTPFETKSFRTFMETIDYAVLFGYFAGMAAIGVWAMKRVKGQEDYFMGGRRFGKLFQTFAAFGAGTGSADPVNTARGTFANGMSGMWGVMYCCLLRPFIG